MNIKMNSPVFRKCFCLLRSPSQQSIKLGKCQFDLVVRSESSSEAMKIRSKLNNSRFQQPNLKKLPSSSSRTTLGKDDSKIMSILSSDQSDPDTFGTLSEDWKSLQQLKTMPEEEGDVVKREFLFNIEGKTKLTISQYAKMIKEFISQKKISLAIDVLETRMKEDRAKPDSYIYNLLIGACGKVGYTKKAFQLYNTMKKRGLMVTGHTYTGLFNACANSPYPEESVKQALHLRGIMIEKAVLMNPTIYHAMIKAFGRCGDLETAFMLVDEMLEKNITVKDETFNFLLQACISDKKAGFRHALLVWRKMLNMWVKPDLFTFNLLLRCSRDCSLGDEKAINEVIQVLLQSRQKPVNAPLLNSPQHSSDSKNQLVVTESKEIVPNLISQQPTMGSVVAVTNITLPEHRLMLLGGCKGVLDQMKRFKITPDMKTFTQLLDQIPSTLQAEQELLTAAREVGGVVFDVDFCNMLIRKRCLRGDYENAKGVVKMIQENNLRPDMMTFGVLAMTCQSQESARQLLQDISNLGLRPNVETLGTLLKNACYQRDCDFVMEIMKTVEEEGLKANEKLLKHLDNFYRFSSKVLRDQKTDDTGRLEQNGFIKFCEYYKSWQRRMSPDPPPDPWSQFQELRPEPEDTAILNLGKDKWAKSF